MGFDQKSTMNNNMEKRVFSLVSFIKLLEIALIVYVIVLGIFLICIYGRINLAKRSLGEDEGINNFEELKR
jgi:type III secretory pathway component EscU